MTSPAGWLRRSGRTIDYNVLYILENSMARPIVYATPQPGYSLDQMLGYYVERFSTVEINATFYRMRTPGRSPGGATPHPPASPSS